MFDDFGDFYTLDASGNRVYDNSSGSGSGSSPSLLDWFKAGGSTATGLLGALQTSKKATAPTGTTNWGLIAGIGAAVVLVLVLIVSLGGRK
jgi:hypothetical protein